MAKFTNEQLAALARPASVTEEQKLENAENAVKNALSNYSLASGEYEVFGQGSYANNTNIRNNSDIDINVCYTGGFYFRLPSGKTREEYGLTNPTTYSYAQFKNDVERILVAHFGRNNVVRKNKCIHIKENTYRVEIDVVPTWKFRRYGTVRYTYDEGVKLYADNNGEEIINFPKQHLKNGVSKNNTTSRRFKRLVRIVKNLHVRMEDEGYYNNANITSFLLECLTYNYPNNNFHIEQECDWNNILREYIYYFWSRTKEDSQEWTQWIEVSECLYLMYGHKWARQDVNTFMYKLWNYLEYN